MIIKDGKCEERSYKTANRITKEEVEEIKECEEIKGKINKAFGKSEKGNSKDNI